MRKSLIIIFFFISIAVNATKYYVKETGNNSNTGLSDAQAWATIEKVNTSTFLPGDSILFNRGDTWRETLTVPSSGNAIAYIVFSSYGTGNNPKILGSTKATKWTHTSGNIWQSAFILTNPYVSSTGDLFFIEADKDTIFGIPQTYSVNFSNLMKEYDWTWNANIVYVYAANDPGTRYTSIEAAQRANCIYLNEKQYIQIDGIDMFYAQQSGVKDYYPTIGSTGYILRNCEIAYLGYKNNYGYGSNVAYNNMLIEHNAIHDVGRRAISIVNYGSTNISNITIQYNTLYNGYHTTGVDIESGSNSGNAGNINNIVIKSNLVYDDPTRSDYYPTSNLLQGPRSGTGNITNVYFYDNVVKGIPDAGLQLENVVGPSLIYNNTFYGFNQVRPTSSGYMVDLYFTHGSTNITVRNNIFYNNASYATNYTAINVYIPNGMDYTQINTDYNLYYTVDTLLPIIKKDPATTVTCLMSGWSAMKSAMGWETDSPTPTDPLFVSTTDYHLQAASPAIGAGIDVGLTTDYDGNASKSPPSIGAYDYNSKSSSPVIPVHQSSVVENATPNLVEIIYDISMANTIPAATAFVVQVNGVNRNVSSVSILGNKIRLTLASAVVFGDKVTLSYNKPASNWLRTTSGGEVSSINYQPVTNNCLNINSSKIKIYPNPAHDFFNISSEEPSQATLVMKIIDFSGKIVYTDHKEQDTKNVKIPENLKTGIYIVTLESGSLIQYAQKLIIYK